MYVERTREKTLVQVETGNVKVLGGSWAAEKVNRWRARSPEI